MFCEIDFVIVEEDELEECLKIVFVDKINDFKMDVDVDFVFEVNWFKMVGVDLVGNLMVK